MQKDPYPRNWVFNRRLEPTFLISTSLVIMFLVIIILRFSWLTLFLLLLSAICWLFIIYFFRDPNRCVIDKPGLVVSPCDGEVVAINKAKEDNYLRMETIQISTFLSVFDVHVQRAPISGEVIQRDHQPGKFLQAFRPEASKVNDNIAMVIDTPHGPILVKQIAGILARRCINYTEIGDQIQTGQRYGLIKFGSRVDLFLPQQADVLINVGDKIKGGLTPVAQLAGMDHE